MEKYTTGEAAQICGTTVRAIQYYDKYKIVSPSEISEGGRRLYYEADIDKLKAVCYFKNLGVSLSSIKKIFNEKNSAKVISAVLKERKVSLKKEIDEYSEDIKEIDRILSKFSGDNQTIDGLLPINDNTIKKIRGEKNMKNKDKKVRTLHMLMLIIGLPLGALEISSIVLWAVQGIWWLFAVWVAVAIPCAIGISKAYFEIINYTCPECGKVFKPKFKEAFFAYHTPNTRKLVCPHCGKKSFCVETSKEPE